MNQRRPSWCGLYVRPRFENVVTANLSLRGLDVFLPTYTTRGRIKEQGPIEVPLFPGYVFCRVDDAEVPPLLMTAGVVHIVGMGAGVKHINESEIVAVRRAIQAGLPCQPCPFRETGRRVRVCKGPLRDLEGILAESTNGTKIVIGISLLQRAVMVELGKSTQVVPILNGQTPERDTERAVGIFRNRSDERGPIIRRIFAATVFDAFSGGVLAGGRGLPATARHMVLQAEDFDIHVQVCGEREDRQIWGQILCRSPENFAIIPRFHLLRNGERLQDVAADTLGQFHFTGVPKGELSLQVDLPHLTIMGTVVVK